VAEICQQVLGFRPSEALTDNRWPGDPDPASQTNDYHGCIATLSNSLEAVATAREDTQAERNCVAKGLAPNTAELSVCVLSAQETRPGSKELRLASLSEAPLLEQTTRSTSMASLDHVPTGLPREQLACAEIGSDPDHGEFKSCVQGLRDVMSASFMAEDYWN
jgi:hypothetical protein